MNQQCQKTVSRHYSKSYVLKHIHFHFKLHNNRVYETTLHIAKYTGLVRVTIQCGSEIVNNKTTLPPVCTAFRFTG